MAAAAATVVIVLSGEDLDQPLVHALLLDWITLPYILSGLVAWWVRPDSRFGPLMIAAGFATFLSSFAVSEIPGLSTIGQLVDFLPAVLFLHVFLAFPSGRLEGRVARALVAAGYVVALGLQVVGMVLGGFGRNNLLKVFSEPGAAESVLRFQLVALSAFSLAGIGVLVARRRAAPPKRRPLALLVDSFALGLVVIPVLYMSHYFQGPAIEQIRWTTFALLGLAPFVFALGLLAAGGRRNQALLEGIPDNIIRLRLDGAYLDVHSHEPDTLGAPPNEIVGTNLRQNVPGEIAERILGACERAVETGEVQTIEYPFESATAGSRYHETRIAPSGDDEVLMVVRDITGRRQRESELRQSRARIVEAGDAERRRLERNLHDGAQQRLVTTALTLRLARAKVSLDPREAERVLEAASLELSRALEDLRELARGLHPAMLSDRGLRPAVEALAARVPLPVAVAIPSERMPQQAEVAAFYVISESLTNVTKYAEATAATVIVSRENGYLVVDVADDGVGGADVEKGTGLRGLKDRVEALAGNVDIKSDEGSGTRVIAEIPCH